MPRDRGPRGLVLLLALALLWVGPGAAAAAADPTPTVSAATAQKEDSSDSPPAEVGVPGGAMESFADSDGTSHGTVSRAANAQAVVTTIPAAAAGDRASKDDGRSAAAATLPGWLPPLGFLLLLCGIAVLPLRRRS